MSNTHDLEKHRLSKIEQRLNVARHTLEGLQPVYDQVATKVRSLKNEIDTLEEERLKIQQGQLSMSFDFDF